MPFISIRAEPISDDDFDIESRALAEEYAEARKKGPKRQRIVGKDGNDRSEQYVTGYQRRSLQNRARTESTDSSDDDDGQMVVRRKRKGVREEMAYEGQVVLEFNPLYRLAGLSEPKKGQEGEAPSLKDLISSHKREAWMANPSQKTSETSATNNAPQKGEEGSSDIEILSDEEVFGLPAEAPTQNPEVGNPSPSSTDEIFDSDEEVFQPVGLESSSPPSSEKVQSSSPIETPISSQSSYVFWNCDNIPSCKPNFPMDNQKVSANPFVLDQETKDIKIPASINRFLKEYQRAGAKFLYDAYKQGRGAVLGDDMGLGKTVQAISFLSAIMRKTGTYVDHQRRKRTIREVVVDMSPRHWPTALIICPKSLISNWSRELDTWGYFEYAVWKSDNWRDVQQKFIHGYLDLMIVSYDVARLDIQHIKDLPLSTVIVDEAHRLKEPMSQTTLALKSIQCQVCFALTGTLVQNRIDEMWSVLDFVHRGWAGTYRQWKEFAVSPIKKGHQVEGTAAEVVRAIMTVGVMTQRILPHFYLRRDKKLIAHELPEKKDLVVFCPLASRQIVAYRALIESDAVVNIQARNRPCPCGSGKSLSALRKVANHFGLLYDHKDDNQHTRMVNRKLFKICTGHEAISRSDYTLEEALDPENCGKWDLLKKLLIQWRNEPVKNKVLIFSTSVRLLKIISRFISTSPSLSGFEFDALTGEASAVERQGMIDRFQDLEKDHFIMLISTRAGGVGLNLTAVVIFDPSWTMDRAFRIGQKRTVEVYRLIGQGTIEELIYERQVQKQQSARQLNNGTLEPRIYQGYDRATNVKDQAELFGVHNLFHFDPNGFAPANLGVHVAKDNFLDEPTRSAEDEGEVDEADQDEDIKLGIRSSSSRISSQSQRHREGREKDKDKRKESEQVEETADMVQSLLEDAPTPPPKAVDILTELGFNSLLHEDVFGDSAEEREIFERGLKILEKNPMLAKSIKANSLTKTQRRTARKPAMVLGPGLGPTIRERREVKKEGKRSHLTEEGHGKERIEVRREKRQKGESNKNLVELSD
ncbi:DNA dependent ATPase [Cryptococcus deuterogattii 99/473]|uniref:Unplaced genomic scaffold supercont1.15, whole genome shotgun sequence n=1 Tax=Cryptococcus deuterogattii Ram5 TaxID=1296110 RepID=A0A0D0UWC0_9TREE|nr:DNA dependent ATPase [Cryptococcus deuterogattii Ram5]KIY55063.1 DNA dependent ATPase [Cryptococcus deuterogattii 99/473]